MTLDNIEVPPDLTGDLDSFRRRLAADGLRGALLFLNVRTTHRFTGVYRFDGEMLRSVALVDKWDPGVARGQDVRLAEAFCSIVHKSGQALEVLDSSKDARFPEMSGSAIACYCGVLICTGSGEPFGALCHFDFKPCQARTSEMPLLVAAGSLIGEELAQDATAARK